MSKLRLLSCLFVATLLINGVAQAAPCPSAMPVAGQFSSGFGKRHGTLHPGVDLRAPIGTTVRSAAGGRVILAARYYDYGLMVEVEHADGSRARYAHLSRVNRSVAAGAVVAPGQPIGAVGRTGRTTGPNVHVELRRRGQPVDPWPWLTGSTCVALTEVAEAPPSR